MCFQNFKHKNKDMKNLKQDDFDNLKRTINFGFLFIGILTCIIAWLSLQLRDAVILNEDIEMKHIEELQSCKETSLKRFKYAKDLTDICNRFKSSREAKSIYLDINGVVE